MTSRAVSRLPLNG